MTGVQRTFWRLWLERHVLTPDVVACIVRQLPAVTGCFAAARAANIALSIAHELTRTTPPRLRGQSYKELRYLLETGCLNGAVWYILANGEHSEVTAGGKT